MCSDVAAKKYPTWSFIACPRKTDRWSGKKHSWCPWTRKRGGSSFAYSVDLGVVRVHR